MMTSRDLRLSRQYSICILVVLIEWASGQNCPSYPTSCPLQQPTWVMANDPSDASFTEVCLRGGTERRSDRCDGISHHAGNFTCQCCGLPLFTAESKCHSGTGWPSFTTTIGACVKPSNEVVCSRCGAHLGDFFHTPGWTADADCHLSDGTPQRFCIDGICLRPPPGTRYGQQCTIPSLACQYGPSVYFGDGCFWHTQYDMFTVEVGTVFNRSIDQITSRAGYAGGFGSGPAGQVCYHGGPAGTFYGDLHYAEAVQITLDPNSGRARCQFEALALKYFTESFQMVNGVVTRGDPNDIGPEYRNVIGVPGGVHGPFYQAIVKNNINNMTLIEGGVNGPGADTIDEGVVYIYNSDLFPFYRAEQYHQFHANWVLHRPLPNSYMVTAKQAAIARGWINPDCADVNAPNPPVTNVNNATTRCPMLASSQCTSSSNATTQASVSPPPQGIHHTSSTGHQESINSPAGIAGIIIGVVVWICAVVVAVYIKRYRKSKVAYVTVDSYVVPELVEDDMDNEMECPQELSVVDFK